MMLSSTEGKGGFFLRLKAQAMMWIISAFPLIYLGKIIGAFLLYKILREFRCSLKEEETDTNKCNL